MLAKFHVAVCYMNLAHACILISVIVMPVIGIHKHLFAKSVNKSSAVAEMGDCLATIDMGRKLGAVPLFEGELGPHLTQSGQGRGLPACQFFHLDLSNCLATTQERHRQDRQTGLSCPIA